MKPWRLGSALSLLLLLASPSIFIISLLSLHNQTNNQNVKNPLQRHPLNPQNNFFVLKKKEIPYVLKHNEVASQESK